MLWRLSFWASTAAWACIEFLHEYRVVKDLFGDVLASTAAWACIEFLLGLTKTNGRISRNWPQQPLGLVLSFYCHCYERLVNNSRKPQQPLGLVLSFYDKDRRPDIAELRKGLNSRLGLY